MLMPKFPSDLREIVEVWNARQADLARLRSAFMEQPPPCAAMVSYRPSNLKGTGHGAEFLFRAADVEAIAGKNAQEFPAFEGMGATVRWTSLRDESITVPTPVSALLVNFDYIAEGMIEAGMGQVRCPACDKIYSVSELERKMEGLGLVASGWLSANYLCPSQHSLLYRQVIHVMRKRFN